VFVENKEALRLLHVLVARPWTQNKRMVFEMATPSLHDLHGLRNQLGMLFAGKRTETAAHVTSTRLI